MSKEFVESVAAQLQQKLLDYRHHFHENPELSFQETNTSQFIHERLEALNIPIRPGISGTSVLGELTGDMPGPTILFRADMDALPVQEENDWVHRSKVPGVMHACGHDIHTSILLCLAEALSKHRELLQGKVLFAFQAAEEKFPGGAAAMIADGAMEGVDMAFALHTGLSEVGTIGLCTGAACMATGMYKVKVEGKGGHTGFPQNARDPVAALCDIALAIQRIVPTKIDPLHPSTVSVSYFGAGSEDFPNIIPESGVIRGTIRCSLTEDRDLIFNEIEHIAACVCQQRGCRCEMEQDLGYPAMFNSAHPVEIVRSAAEELGIGVIERPPMMGGEDFSYFQQKCPGAFFTLGLYDAARPETKTSQHNPRYMPAEEGFINGLKMMLEVYLRASKL